MEEIWVGCGQITWGRAIPQEQVLAEIAQAGYYEGAPAGLESATISRNYLKSIRYLAIELIDLEECNEQNYSENRFCSLVSLQFLPVVSEDAR